MFNLHISIERWKYNKNYQVYVSTEGRIKDKNKNLLTLVPTNGYMSCIIEDLGPKPVHRLVMETFKPTTDRGLTVDHIDHNRRNNSLKNLRWLSFKENSNDAVVYEFYENLKKLGVKEYLQEQANKKLHEFSAEIQVGDSNRWISIANKAKPHMAICCPIEEAARRIAKKTGEIYKGQILYDLRDIVDNKIKDKKKYGYILSYADM